ncbi:dymeclin [Cephus cinctus]|uniref:Dymeclin n=1 Tax=Cephus cinctus TaxID=211228 RepID=A0AAJ7BMY8_CEPCN|nr:dymeclin [Cephus cinctus]
MGIGSGLKNFQVASHGYIDQDKKKRDMETPLASQSLLLLLVLTNHCTATSNPYRDALFTFTDMEDGDPMTPTKAITTFQFNLHKLYATICKIPSTDQVTLLLYMLLHRNPNVKKYIMKRPDINLLV